MKKYTFAAIVLLFLYILLEVCLRLVLCISTSATFVHPSRIIYQYYPELLPIEQASVSNTDSTLDILILSCSVLHKDWLDIVHEMNTCLQLPTGYNKLKIYNASGIGHGSRDNLVKYELLKDKKFDIILYYDAINDSRLNNCPEEVFKNDYSHYRWYDEINHIISHHEMDVTVVPFFVDWMKIRLKAMLVHDAYIPIHYSLRPEWQEYGDNFKSLKCYEANVKSIAARAEQQQAQLVYLTFAWYLPADYSLQKFQAKTLDYTFCDHSRETEIWGLARNVGRFIDTVNHSSRSWLSQYPHAHWVDAQAAIPKEGKSFADVCHFSPVGIHQFAGVTCKELDSLLNVKAH